MDKKKRQALAKGISKVSSGLASDESKPVTTAKVKTPKAPKTAKEPKVARPVVEAKEGAMPPMPKIPGAARGKRERPTRPCACGCGTLTKATWAPGHDARANGWAIRLERGICQMKDVPEGERAGAKLKLEEHKGGVAKADIKIVKKMKPEAEAAEPAAAAVNE